MNSELFKALLWGFITGLYLRFGLEPTGWLFYEASHALGIDWLYWGYSIFRGAGYAFGLWQFQTLACLLAGAVVALVIKRKNGREVAL
jgi:apolipoprotein N-acyltransferase